MGNFCHGTNENVDQRIPGGDDFGPIPKFEGASIIASPPDVLTVTSSSAEVERSPVVERGGEGTASEPPRRWKNAVSLAFEG